MVVVVVVVIAINITRGGGGGSSCSNTIQGFAVAVPLQFRLKPEAQNRRGKNQRYPASASTSQLYHEAGGGAWPPRSRRFCRCCTVAV